MKTLNKAAGLVCAVACAHGALADVEFGASVPREVVEQFLGNPFGRETTLYSDIFSAFPPFTLPEGFEVLASVDQGQLQRVILRSNLDDAAIRAALTAAFVAEGWIELPLPETARPQTGFVSAAPQQRLPTQLCSDRLGRLTLNVSGEGPRYASVNVQNIASFFGNSQPSCAQQAEMNAAGPGGMRGFASGRELMQHMPALVLPESDLPGFAPQVNMVGGFSGSSDDMETRGQLAISWSSDDLLEHFADQLDAQDWEQDSAVNGEYVAFGSWTKTIDGNDYLGALTLTQVAENSWHLKFRLLRQR